MGLSLSPGEPWVTDGSSCQLLECTHHQDFSPLSFSLLHLAPRDPVWSSAPVSRLLPVGPPVSPHVAPEGAHRSSPGELRHPSHGSAVAIRNGVTAGTVQSKKLSNLCRNESLRGPYAFRVYGSLWWFLMWWTYAFVWFRCIFGVD